MIQAFATKTLKIERRGFDWIYIEGHREIEEEPKGLQSRAGVWESVILETKWNYKRFELLYGYEYNFTFLRVFIYSGFLFSVFVFWGFKKVLPICLDSYSKFCDSLDGWILYYNVCFLGLRFRHGKHVILLPGFCCSPLKLGGFLCTCFGRFIDLFIWVMCLFLVYFFFVFLRMKRFTPD